MLIATDLGFRYPGSAEWTIRHAAFMFHPRTRTGLFAPSGRGKTTLCKLLAGYLLPQEGTVLLEGKPLPRKGYCPVQMIWQHPELAVNSRLRLRATLAEAGPVEPRLLESLGIEPAWLDRFPQELSGGELQRICVARALGPGTRYLLADEITTMLDPITQAQIWQFLLAETHARGIGLLAVSHDEALLAHIADEVLSIQPSIPPTSMSFP